MTSRDPSAAVMTCVQTTAFTGQRTADETLETSEIINTRITSSQKWAPNPSKTRFYLGHKGLPYEVIRVKFRDIAATMKDIAASPTAGKSYTDVPAIKDPNTGMVVRWSPTPMQLPNTSTRPILTNHLYPAEHTFS
ncbi:hypothetical protein C8R48DRAFT_773154 [Suillus tomentosus]|nr:hypothetical protein C8R48DRAFT_773154 [Suillus tomentosus]